MSAQRKAVLSGVALAGLLLLIAYMAGMFRDRTDPGLRDINAANSSDIYTVALVDLPSTERVAASVEARETTTISARLLARVEEITVRAGDYAEAGQLLVRLEQDDLLAQARQAAEAVRSLQARLTEAVQNRERAVELHQRQLIADADLDSAIANAATLEAELAGARQAEQAAKSALSYSEIRSPLAGRVVDRFVEPGDTVSPGQNILSLYNPFSLRIEAWVREARALTLQEGQTLEVEIPALERRLEARIEELVPAADPGSRAFRIKAALPTAPGLLPGMFARLVVPGDVQQVIAVPRDRIAQVGQLNVAWVNGESGPRRRFLRLGQELDGLQVIVIAGLTPGDELLLPPLQ